MRDLLSDSARACPDWVQFEMGGLTLGAICGAVIMALLYEWLVRR